MNSRRPLVLCIAGHDPSGGAGIQADAETVHALGGHALTVIAALTAQDSNNVVRVAPVGVDLLAEQLRLLLNDCQIDAIKIGLLGSASQLPPILEAIAYARVPVVFDPVLRAGGGADLVAAELQSAVIASLLPRTTLLTPNAAEARRLTGVEGHAGAAKALLAAGCENVLVTGGDEPGEDVTNSWYRAGAAVVDYHWPRLPEVFHGAGCTLSSAIAALLARGLNLAEAVEQAQRWTQQSLRQAFAIGRGRRIPGRQP